MSSWCKSDFVLHLPWLRCPHRFPILVYGKQSVRDRPLGFTFHFTLFALRLIHFTFQVLPYPFHTSTVKQWAIDSDNQTASWWGNKRNSKWARGLCRVLVEWRQLTDVTKCKASLCSIIVNDVYGLTVNGEQPAFVGELFLCYIWQVVCSRLPGDQLR